MVCEDMWTEDVAEGLGESGAEILIVPNGSPFEHDKQDVRLNLAVARVTETGLPLIYCNQVGGQDELVFDGASFVLNADRRLRCAGRSLRGSNCCSPAGNAARTSSGAAPAAACAAPVIGLEAIYRAMCLGLRDYVDKNRFPGVVLGLSGGIDFGALRRRRGRCARARAGARCDDAVALHLGAPAPRMPRRAPRALGIRLDRIADRAGGGRIRHDARAGVRGP